MKKVFISYQYRDGQAKAYAAFLREHLPAFGAEAIDVFMDESISAGEDWQTSMTEAINQSSIVICFAGEMNPNVMLELGYALGKNKQIILVGDSQSIPSDLQQMIFVPRESHPYDLLEQVQKCLSSHKDRQPYLGLDPRTPKPSLGILTERPDILDSLQGREFEDMVKEWFLAKGYRLRDQDVTRDYGFDFLVHPFRGETAAVEVKKYRTTSRVPVAVVRQVLGAMVAENIPIGIVVSSAPYTESAVYFAKEIEPPVLLWTLEDLVKMTDEPNNRLECTGDPRGGSPDTQP